MGMALDGIAVLDLTAEFWAAVASALLGDFGATVIRIENPAAPREPLEREDGPPAPWNYRYELANRNKLGFAVDWRTERGREVLRRLVQRADALVTDWSLSELRVLGLDPEAATAANPRLVYARGSGLGPEGPDRELPAIDALAAARTGLMGILPQPGQPPVYAGHGQMYTAVFLAFGVATALYHRLASGTGQRVDTSLLAGNMYAASLDLQAFLAIGGERLLQPIARTDVGNPMSGSLYPTADGRWITLTMPDTERWWPRLAEAVGLDPSDPRFDTHEKRCELPRRELIALLDERFRAQPASHWRAAFEAMQMSADVIEDYSYPARDPQARRNRYIVEARDPHLGPLRMVGFPIFMSETPARWRRSAPRTGQHTAEVLREFLGFSEEEVLALEESRAVG